MASSLEEQPGQWYRNLVVAVEIHNLDLALAARPLPGEEEHWTEIPLTQEPDDHWIEVMLAHWNMGIGCMVLEQERTGLGQVAVTVAAAGAVDNVP